MRFKPSEALRFLGGLAAVVIVLGLIVLRVTSCAPMPTPRQAPQAGPVAASPAPPPAVSTPASCEDGPDAAAAANSQSLHALAWAPYRRPETGWEVYVPVVQREIGTPCPPESPAFAQALAGWQRRLGIPADGVFSAALFEPMRVRMELRRPTVRLMNRRICPDPPPESALAWATKEEGYSGKPIQLRPAVLAAYRRMAVAARAEDPSIAADPRNLTIFSGFRSPASDAVRCAAQGNCDGTTRGACSPHRTGLTLDMYVGQAPGYGPDSSADPNRLFMSRTPTYRWLVLNADRFGFAPYPFEPWHWEWTGEAP